ncbi:MAG: ABC transporter substrate-binding protein [Deltaproteobacteria bacterium]|nr:ABC transporter substrate-binding protein [Deltaproteobacteria bacterium]
MKRRTYCLSGIIFLAVFVLLSTGNAASLKKVRGAFSALAYANPPFWIARELRIFDKYGLDVELVYVSGSRPIQAMLGGSIDVSQVGGAATVAAAAQGADVLILGTVFTRLVFAVHASPQIKQISDLKGKTVAAGSIGGNSYFAGLLFLAKFGWTPNRDVGLMAAGGSPEVLAALAQGKFQAGVMAPPTTHAATRLGFREIFDLASLDFPFPVISVVSTRKFIQANPDIILNVLRATAEAIHLYKTRPDLTLPVVAKYMRVPKDDAALVQSQVTYGKHMNETLAPSLDGIKFVLDFLAEQRPALKGRNPAEFVDMKFLKKLEEEGFFKKLSGH